MICPNRSLVTCYYADDSCLVYTGKDIDKIETQLNSDFNSLCDWFVDNKLSIHFGEDKTKSIIFGSKRKLRSLKELDIRRGNVKIKQHSEVTYLGVCLIVHCLESPWLHMHLGK